MSAATSPAGAKSTAETAELRKAEGKRGAGNCGRTAEKVRKLSHSLVSDLGPTFDPSPALVRPVASKKAREAVCAEAPHGRGAALQAHEQAVIDSALAILVSRMRKPGAVFDAPRNVKDFLTLHLAGREREAFGVIFLDVRHGVIAFEVLFEGTLTHTAVYPRVVVRRAMALNAAAVILSHNHPSGVPEASRADELLTQALRQALHLVDVLVVDHVVVAGDRAMSFAECGLL